MVNYDKNADALTLGDDDSLKVGDYELKYSNANDRFEVEHPNGEVSDVPRSTSGSLVPEGFADVLSNGEVLADNGEIYASVQDAVNAASGFVFVGPGTFNESVSISTEGLTLEGSGYDTLIDGGTTGDAIAVNADNVTVKSLSVQTTSGGGTNADGIQSSNPATTIDSVAVRASDQYGFTCSGADTTITNCKSESSIDGRGVLITGVRSSITSSVITGSSDDAIECRVDDCIIANNILDSSGVNGIDLRGSSDTLIGGNRVIGASTWGIRTDSNSFDNIIYNNRISDSGSGDIDDQGTGTVLDGNLTGASN